MSAPASSWAPDDLVRRNAPIIKGQVIERIPAVFFAHANEEPCGPRVDFAAGIPDSPRIFQARAAIRRDPTCHCNRHADRKWVIILDGEFQCYAKSSALQYRRPTHGFVQQGCQDTS